jgi:hypothetical protein
MDALTPEQHAVLVDRGPVRATGDQTHAQAVELAVAGFRAACQFEGIPVPSGDAVRVALGRRPSPPISGPA